MKACWKIIRNRKGANLVYDNMATGMRHKCGAQPSHVTDEQILEWIVVHGGIGEGDLVKLSDGKTLHFQMPGAGCN